MRSILALLLCALLPAIIGCSTSGDKGPTQPADIQLRDYELSDGHSVIAAGSLLVPLDGGEVINIPNRTLLSHFEVSDMLLNPSCPGGQCLRTFLTYYDPVESEYWLDIQVLNPTAISPWDPRVIFLTSDYPDDFDVLNADSWVTLYDTDEDPDNRNPFIAMAKEEIYQRRLPPFPFWDTEVLILYQNPDKDPDLEIPYLFDINFPGHCREPYEINNIRFMEPWGKLWKNPITAYEESFTVACDVFDWQDDIIEVSFYAPDIFGDEEWYPLDPHWDTVTYPDTWVADFEDIDTMDIDQGYHEAWFRALSDTPTDEVDHIYQRYNFPLLNFDDSGGGTGADTKPQLVYLKDKTGYADIYKKDLGLGAAEKLLIDYTTYPSWLAVEKYRPAISDLTTTGYWVVFSADKDGQIDLYRVPVDGSLPPAKITDTWFDEFGPRFEPDDGVGTVPTDLDIVYYSYEFGQADLYITSLFPTSMPTQLTSHIGEDIDPCYSPDGDWIAFSSNRADWSNYEIFIRSSDPNIYDLYRLTWDPGNDLRPSWGGRILALSEIVFQSDRKKDFDLFKYIYSEGVVVKLFDAEGDQIDPCYSYDGQSIVFAWSKEEYFNLYTIPWNYNETGEFLYARTHNSYDDWSPDWGLVPK